jgi:hypothetical protein
MKRRRGEEGEKKGRRRGEEGEKKGRRRGEERKGKGGIKNGYLNTIWMCL